MTNERKLYIMKTNNSMGTRDFLLIDDDNNTVEKGSTHATPYNVRKLENKTVFASKRELNRAFKQLIARGYKEIDRYS